MASIVTDLPLKLTAARQGASYKAPCLESGGTDCGACLQRCPVQAISGDGLDKSKCYERRQAIRENSLQFFLRKFRLRPSLIVKGGRREMGFSLGCALRLSGVPCEAAAYPAAMS